MKLYPNGVLGDAASTMEQMLTGTITGSTPADGALSAFAPDIQVFTIPYLFDNPTIAYDVLEMCIRDRAGAGQEDPQGVDHPGVSGRLLHPQGTGHSRHRAREHEVSG